MDISTAVAEAIKNNLPAATASELSKFITDAKNDKAQLEQSIKDLALKITQLKDAGDLNIELAARLKKAGDIEVREKEATQREIMLGLQIANIEKEEAVKRANILQELVGTVFRNPVVKRSVLENNSISSSYRSDGSSIPVVTGKSIQETTEEL